MPIPNWMPDIPLIIDDMVEASAFPMTRLIYFHIEAEETLDPWVLGNYTFHF